MKRCAYLGIVLAGLRLTAMVAQAQPTVSNPPAIKGLRLTNGVVSVLFTNGQLQSALTVAGPWTNYGITNGPYSEPVASGAASKFYRVLGIGRQTAFEPTTGRRFILYVPTSYNPTNAYPLIVSSHGTSQNGDTEMDSTGPNNTYDRGGPTWPTLAETSHVIVACPDFTGAYGENGCAISSTHANQLASDEPVVLGVITMMEKAYHINTSRILMTGFSGGGNVTHYVWLRHPDLFIGNCARHGNFNTSLVPSALSAGITNKPVYIFTGNNDSVCGTSDAITWYTAQGFAHLKTDIFTNTPDNLHTTDRQYALSWLLSL